jgi:hypothetical protein
MSDKKNNAAAPGVAALQSDFDAKTAVLNGLDETATPEDREKAQADVDEAKLALDKANEPAAKPSTKKVKGTFVLSPTGRFSLAYSVGEEASLPELQAKELEEAGYFKIK